MLVFKYILTYILNNVNSKMNFFYILCLFYDNVLIINFRKCPNNKIS